MNLSLSLPKLKLPRPRLSMPDFSLSAARLNLNAKEMTAQDSWLLFSGISLLLMGFLMITSASMEVAGRNYGQPFFFATRHLIFMTLGALSAVVCFLIPSKFWQRTGHWWLLMAALLLVAVLIPGIGREVNGSSRWISLGPVNLQPSELAKLFFVMFLAGYLVRRLDEVRSHWRGFIKPLAVLSIILVLLVLEPDFGAMVVLMGAMLGMMFLGGMRLLQFAVVITCAMGVMALVAVSQPYRMQRLVTFLDPWADPFGSGYQLSQAQIAFARGEWFGLGLGNSVQKLFFLPEAHTDFVFSVLAEELGLLGALVMVILFAILVYRAFSIGRKAELLRRHYQGYLCYGIGFILAGQALINIGVNVGVLPTKGLTLPLVSYGGSSLIVSMVMVSLLCRIHFENYYLEKRYHEQDAQNGRARKGGGK